MGIFQPGGPGTAINVYDDNNGAGGHTIGQPHTFQEINTFAPGDFPIMAIAGVPFAGRSIFGCAVDVTIGDPGGASNQTTLTDRNVDIYSPPGSAVQSRFRLGNVAPAGVTTLNFGDKIGTGKKSDGKNGCNIFAGSVLRFRCNGAFYGCCFFGQSLVQFQTAGTNGQELAGCKVQAFGSYTLGDGGPFNVYNSSFVQTGGAIAFLTNAVITDSFGVILSATAPTFFMSSGAIGVKAFNRVMLNGAVTLADFRITGSAGPWRAADLVYSDTAGRPKVVFTGAHPVTNGFEDYRTFDTKVVDENGNSLQAIPVYVESDVEGVILDTQTGFDGNVAFTWPPTGVANVLPVREYYDPTGSGTTALRDRVYTIWYNSFKGAFAPNPNYETEKRIVEWPGRDRLGTGYQTDGGSFQDALDLVQLRRGIPSTSEPSEKEEWRSGLA